MSQLESDHQSTPPTSLTPEQIQYYLQNPEALPEYGAALVIVHKRPAFQYIRYILDAQNRCNSFFLISAGNFIPKAERIANALVNEHDFHQYAKDDNTDVEGHPNQLITLVTKGGLASLSIEETKKSKTSLFSALKNRILRKA